MKKIIKGIIFTALYYGIWFAVSYFMRNENLITPFSLLGIVIAFGVPFIIWNLRDDLSIGLDPIAIIHLMVVMYCVYYFWIFLYNDTSLPFHNYSIVKLTLLSAGAAFLLLIPSFIISFIVGIIWTFIGFVYSVLKKDNSENQSVVNETNHVVKTAGSKVKDDKDDDYDKIVDVPILPRKD